MPNRGVFRISVVDVEPVHATSARSHPWTYSVRNRCNGKRPATSGGGPQRRVHSVRQAQRQQTARRFPGPGAQCVVSDRPRECGPHLAHLAHLAHRPHWAARPDWAFHAFHALLAQWFGAVRTRSDTPHSCGGVGEEPGRPRPDHRDYRQHRPADAETDGTCAEHGEPCRRCFPSCDGGSGGSIAWPFTQKPGRRWIQAARRGCRRSRCRRVGCEAFAGPGAGGLWRLTPKSPIARRWLHATGRRCLGAR
jgi:hypothetical protein